MSLATLLKQPAEVLLRPMTFSGVSTIQELLDVTVAARGLVSGAAALVATPALFAGALNLELTGGTDGETYLVTVRVRDAVGQEVESELEVAVIDAAWTMPDGGAPYLTIDEFVRRFGLPEVVRMTDTIGDGRIDRDFLVGKLTDAQAIADAHISSKFTVPLIDVPLVVKTIIGDLAAARLYPNGAPDGVADTAKTAMRMLERIQSGAMNIPAATAPVEAVSDNPVLVSPGRRAYPDGLAGF